MNRLRIRPSRSLQRGIAAVELALILPIMLMMMFAMFQFGKIVWQYNAVKKATHDAARFLARMPASDMQVLALADDAKGKAQTMVVNAAADASIRTTIVPGAVGVSFMCGVNSNAVCTYSSGPANPITKVSVAVDIPFNDDPIVNLGDWGLNLGVGTFTLHAESTMGTTN